MTKLKKATLALAAAGLLSSGAGQAATYQVNFDGTEIDLTGTITTNVLGSFSPTSFDAVVTSYSITGSTNVNGTDYVFTWTESDSTWGGVAGVAGATTSPST